MSNLSAAYFEIGHYKKCIETAGKALKLSGAKESPLLARLSPRLIKAHLQLHQLEDARKALSGMVLENASWATYDAAITQVTAAYAEARDESFMRSEIIKSIPKYLPTL